MRYDEPSPWPSGTKGSRSRALVATKSFLEHSAQHWHFNFCVVVDPHLALPGMKPMEATRVLDKRPFPRYRHRQKQRVEPGIVEPFTDVAPGRDDQALFVGGN